MKKITKFQFTISGLLISLILISMFATVFSTFMVELNSEYNLTGVNSFSKYNATNDVLQYTQQERDSSDINQDDGFLDIIGAYFTRGYAAVKTSMASVDLAEDMLDDATKDVEVLAGVDFMSFIVMIISVGIVICVVISVLVKRNI